VRSPFIRIASDVHLHSLLGERELPIRNIDDFFYVQKGFIAEIILGSVVTLYSKGH